MVVTVGSFVNMSSTERRRVLRGMPRADVEKLIKAVFEYAAAEVRAANSVRGPGVGSWLSKAFGKVKDTLGDIVAVAAPIVGAVVPGAAPVIAAVQAIVDKNKAQPAQPQIQYVQAPAQAQAASSGGLVLVGLAALVLLGSRR